MAENKIDNPEEIILGSGDLYVVAFKGGQVPDDGTIETDVNRAGNTKGGAALEYSSSSQTVEDDEGHVKRTVITKENLTMKTGMLTWAEHWIKALLPTARVDKESKPGHAIWKIGGLSQQGTDGYLFRFVHTRDDGRKLRVTVTGKNTGPVALKFDPENPSTVDGEITANSLDKDGTLVIVDDELTPGAAAASVPGNKK